MMDDDSTDNTEVELIDKLKSLPLREVPPGLTAQVMTRLSRSRTSRLHTIWNKFSRTYTFSFRPVHAFSLLLIACAAFYLGRLSQPAPPSTPADRSAPLELQPAMIDVPQSAYLVGRGLLQSDGSREQALAFLQRASMLEPENPEFAYWEGVGYWANGDQELERRSYLRGLEANPDYTPLLINLGHSYLSDKRYDEALDAYRAVLSRHPYQPEALYNSGLIYRALGLTGEEIPSWRSYLQHNRQGPQAYRALSRLHGYGDYTFRMYRIGAQSVIVNQQRLLDAAEGGYTQVEELDDVAALLEQNDALHLEIVVFIENDGEAARKRALALKKIIAARAAADLHSRVGLSWFDVAEKIQATGAERYLRLPEGVLLFTHLNEIREREESI